MAKPLCWLGFVAFSGSFVQIHSSHSLSGSTLVERSLPASIAWQPAIWDENLPI